MGSRKRRARPAVAREFTKPTNGNFARFWRRDRDRQPLAGRQARVFYASSLCWAGRSLGCRISGLNWGFRARRLRLQWGDGAVGLFSWGKSLGCERERGEQRLTLENVQVLVLERVPQLVWRHHSRRGLRSSFPCRHDRKIPQSCPPFPALFREPLPPPWLRSVHDAYVQNSYLLDPWGQK